MSDNSPAKASEIKFEDLSGIELKPGDNPYTALIDACGNDHAKIQEIYAAHRSKRNEQQKAKFLAPDFKELSIDQTLLRLERTDVEPGFRDQRNCLVFWARPPEHILKLAAKIQGLLKEASPGLWIMPTQRMHMTTLEVAFSKTLPEIEQYLRKLRPAVPSIVNHAFSHRSRLVKPMVSYDLSALALSFLPANGEVHALPPSQTLASPTVEGDEYTYHHLRRDVFAMTQEAGIEVGSRYQVPSAHITLGRFLDQEDQDLPEKRQKWTAAIDTVNKWLQEEVWDNTDGDFRGEWVVGQERGLDLRAGTLWYGGGRTVMMGEGF